MEATLKVENVCPLCQGYKHLNPRLPDGRVDYTRLIPCDCYLLEYEENKKQALLKYCVMPEGAGKMTFETYKIYPELKAAYEMAKTMANNPGTMSWASFIGGNGTGKTHLGVAICKAWLAAGIPARYALVSVLLEELRQGFNKETSDYDAKFKYYCEVPLLMLDDYGIQSNTGWVKEKLDTIIDCRLMNGVSLIVTSNLTLDEMPDRVRSRLLRPTNSNIIAMIAPDYSLRSK